nr:MAG TPA: hypothetical protein [Caudoviricetes sp.]
MKSYGIYYWINIGLVSNSAPNEVSVQTPLLN